MRPSSSTTDSVGVLQAGGALADDEYGQIARQSSQSLAQGRVGGVVQCAGTVVEDEDVRFAYEGAGDGQTPFLTAGGGCVRPAPPVRRGQGAWLSRTRSLCRFQRSL